MTQEERELQHTREQRDLLSDIAPSERMDIFRMERRKVRREAKAVAPDVLGVLVAVAKALRR